MADEQIVIGRLQKRIAKLQQQRDYYRQRCEHYAEVMNLHPFIERSVQAWREEKTERERVKGLEQRIKEQALLIAKWLPIVERSEVTR